MILRKVIKDGKEVYEKIDFNEAVKINKSELIFTSEDEEDEFDDYIEEKMDECDDDIDDLDDELEDIEDELDDLDESEKEDIEKIKNVLLDKKEKVVDLLSKLKKEKDAFLNGAEEGIDADFESILKGNKKKLLFLLPFLGNDKIEEIAKEKLDGNPKYASIKLVEILPFLSAETLDRLFLENLKDENKKDMLLSFAPFVSNKALDYLCDEFCKGNLEHININYFYPFMNKESINKIFDYYLNK